MSLQRRDFIKSVVALAATAALPLAAPTKGCPWQMVLYKDDTIIARCDGVVQSNLDTFDGEFTFDKAGTFEGVYLQHKVRKTTTHGVSFPSIHVTSGDVLRMEYKLERGSV